MLKSPTIPEEEDESAATEPRAEPCSSSAGATTATTTIRGKLRDTNNKHEASLATPEVCQHDLQPDHRVANQQQQRLPSESFMVATIADESGDHSRTLVIYSDRTLEDLTRDVLKKLIEIELDRRRCENEPQANGDSDGETSPSCKSNESDKQMPELEIEARKLARLFKSHLDGARSPSSPCPFVRPTRYDPTAMSADERARFGRGGGAGVRPSRAESSAKGCRCEPTATSSINGPQLGDEVVASSPDKAQTSSSGGGGNSEQQHRDIYDFRCSCCCLHLVKQPSRDEGERWCCCDCG